MTGIELGALVAMAAQAAVLMATEGVKEVGKKTVGAVWGKLAGLFRSKEKVQEAYDDLAGQAENADNPDPSSAADAAGSLRIQLRKAIAADPAFGEALRGVVEEIEKDHPDIRQSVNIVGDGNTVTQISGDGNEVSIGRS